MIFRTFIMAVCLVGLPQESEAQSSISEIFEQIRGNAAEVQRENAKREERYRRERKTLRRGNVGPTIKELESRLKAISKRIEANNKIIADLRAKIDHAIKDPIPRVSNRSIEEEQEIAQLRAELDAALAEDQRDAVGLPRTSKAFGH